MPERLFRLFQSESKAAQFSDDFRTSAGATLVANGHPGDVDAVSDADLQTLSHVRVFSSTGQSRVPHELTGTFS